jgi:N12 class adenine-specific DNA methylase
VKAWSAPKQLEGKLGNWRNEKKDDGLTFEELGVDRAFVDEAQYAKNLFYVSKMTRIAGLPQTASQRAFDMFLKVQHVQRLNGGGGVVFATGTPISNSVAEMFTMQRFLQMQTLKAHNVAHFDAWAATFGEPVTAMELAPDGSGYRLDLVREILECSGVDADVSASCGHSDPGHAQAAGAGFARRQAHRRERAVLAGVENDCAITGGTR